MPWPISESGYFPGHCAADKLPPCRFGASAAGDFAAHPRAPIARFCSLPARQIRCVELLKAAAQQRLAAGQGELDLVLSAAVPGRPLPVTSSRMGHLLAALAHGCRVLGFEDGTGGDGVFRQLVLARIIEPISTLDSGRVLEEAGVVRPAERCPGLVVLVEELTHTLKLNSNGLAYAVNGNAVRFLPADALEGYGPAGGPAPVTVISAKGETLMTGQSGHSGRLADLRAPGTGRSSSSEVRKASSQPRFTTPQVSTTAQQSYGGRWIPASSPRTSGFPWSS